MRRKLGAPFRHLARQKRQVAFSLVAGWPRRYTDLSIMNTNTIAVLFGAAVAVGYGLADFFGAGASKKIGAITSLVAINTIMLALYVPFYILVLHAHPVWQASGVGFAVAGGLLVNTASILYFKAFVAGPVSLVSPISGAYPLVSTLLAVVVFGAHLSTRQLAAIVVVVAGVMTAGGLFSAPRGKRRIGRGPLLALASVAFYGTGFSCLAQASERIGWQTTTLIEFVVLVIAIVASTPLATRSERLFTDLAKSFANWFVIAGGLTAVVTIAIFNLGFAHERTSGAITIAVSSCYSVITAVLALHHFKEELRLVPLLGAAATVAGVVALSLG